jgi:hypothetical protein
MGDIHHSLIFDNLLFLETGLCNLYSKKYRLIDRFFSPELNLDRLLDRVFTGLVLDRKAEQRFETGKRIQNPVLLENLSEVLFSISKLCSVFLSEKEPD